MFNKFVWELYLQSGGSQVVKMFQDNLSLEMTQEYIDEIIRMRKTYCIMDDVIEEMRLQLQEVIKLDKEFGRDFGELDSVDSDNKSVDYSDTLTEFYRNMLKECITDQAVFAEFSGGISFYTTNLSITFPEFFVPYYYRFNFNVLLRIAEAFEIELPEIPVKKDYKGRVLYYGEISRIFLGFAKENALSRYELCAFLYDFAPQYIGGVDSYIVKDLPAPRSAFFIGADRNDQFLAENHSEITLWQCSPDTRVGDMIVMYMRTPISAVDSIWRACSVGFIDPFFYYYRCVYISNPLKL